MIKKLINYIFGTSKSKAERDAKIVYQITEYAGVLWLTYNGALVCPTDMLSNKDSIKALQSLRDLYVERSVTYNEE